MPLLLTFQVTSLFRVGLDVISVTLYNLTKTNLKIVGSLHIFSAKGIDRLTAALLGYLSGE
jgi:hypothetical protein